MDFSLEQRLAITEAIIKRNIRFKDGEVVFYDNDRRNLPSTTSVPCMSSQAWSLSSLKSHARPGSSLDIISLSVLVGKPLDRITRQPIEVSNFRSICTYEFRKPWFDRRTATSSTRVPCLWLLDDLPLAFRKILDTLSQSHPFYLLSLPKSCPKRE